MNFVIFCYSFPPRCGAETFCSARFASALAHAGHNVHVVTMDHPWAISREVYDFLVDSSIKITRIPKRRVSKFNVIPMRLLHRMRGNDAVDFDNCVKTLKSVLRATESPVLISRSMPEISCMVAWHCRKYASKWIAHFSDPFPWDMGRWYTIKSWILSRWGLAWGRLIIRDSDVVSLTCESAKQIFHQMYGKLFDTKKVIVTTHIGEPPLVTRRTWTRDCDGTLIVHAGWLCKERGGLKMLDAIRQLNTAGQRFYFYQIGAAAADVEAMLGQSDRAKQVVDTSPDLAMAMANSADICFIPDLQTHLDYSPFLPSKFVYQLFTDIPIVAYTRKNSEMACYARRFPSAGIVFADVEEEGSLALAIQKAAALVKTDIQRTSIRSLFSRRAICETVEKVLSGE